MDHAIVYQSYVLCYSDVYTHHTMQQSGRDASDNFQMTPLSIWYMDDRGVQLYSKAFRLLDRRRLHISHST